MYLLQLRDAVAPGELAFPAYSREEIVQIISSRLEGVSTAAGGSAEPVIKAGAVRFLAAKISALSGDVRKALDVCRRALELSEVETKKQVWSLTQFYSVDFSQSRIGGNKCVFNKRTIKVCVSCCCRCPGTSGPSAAHLMVFLYLCSSESNARGESRALDERRDSTKSPSRV